MAARTLVLRVRFMTGPALMTRSNSKLPFWLTGDMTLALFARRASKRGCWVGVSSFMGDGRMVMGLVGVCRVTSVMVTAMMGWAASRSGCRSVCVCERCGLTANGGMFEESTRI